MYILCNQYGNVFGEGFGRIRMEKITIIKRGLGLNHYYYLLSGRIYKWKEMKKTFFTFIIKNVFWTKNSIIFVLLKQT